MLPYHFGIGNHSAELLYGAGIAAIVLSLFWRPLIGLLYLVPLLPLQTVRYRMLDYPLGSSMVSLVIVAVVLGIALRRGFVHTPWNRALSVYCAFLFISVCAGSYYLGRTEIIYFDDSRFADFKDYILMPLLLIAVAAAVKTRREVLLIAILLCMGIMAVNAGVWSTFSGRDYSNYSDDMRESGVLGQAGANGLGAFTAQAGVSCLAVAAFVRPLWLKLPFYGLSFFSSLCLMYSFSRGAYIAFFAAVLFVGIFKQRLLLVGMLVFGLLWASVVPEAVRDRVGIGGGLDHSSETRVTLWEDALTLAGANIILGTGFNTYAYLGRVGNYKDTHNMYVKVLVETGIVGLLLFLTILFLTFLFGMRLTRTSDDWLYQGLGFSLATWLVCTAIVNLFGDRWTYLQVNGYMWILAGLVSRAFLLSADERNDSCAPTADDEEPESSDNRVFAL